MIPIVALVLSLLTLFLTLWIVLPAPHRIFWLLSILVGEWSLYAGLVGILGLLAGMYSFESNHNASGYIAVTAGLAALLISLYPYVTSQPVASSLDAELSLSQYVLGASSASTPAVKTYRYSEAGGQQLSMDVYSTGPGQDRPAIVVVHGGSWNGGSRSDFPAWNHWLVDQGFVVFDIDYRLAPQPNWQTATQDVQDAIRWIKQRAEQFGINPNRVALLGRSAGGHLALLAAYTAQHSGRPINAQVQAVVAFYAPVDLTWGYENPAKVSVNDGSAQLRQFTGGTPETAPDVYRQASPLSYIDKNTPPTLLIHGEKDQLVGTFHSTSLIEHLHKINQEHRLVLIPYAQHGFDFNFTGWGSQIAQAAIMRHLKAMI